MHLSLSLYIYIYRERERVFRGWTCGPLLLEFVGKFLQPLTREPMTLERPYVYIYIYIYVYIYTYIYIYI